MILISISLSITKYTKCKNNHLVLASPTNAVLISPHQQRNEVSMKKTKEQKYADGLEGKGLKKICVIVPIRQEETVKNFALGLRMQHLGSKK